MNKIFALVDCNNFFVSCERVFDPKYKDRPAVVLSNNDGCIVARSNEAKRLGIKMAEPLFQCMEIIDFFNVKLYSSNFSLYQDMSHRVMEVLSAFSENIEIYSIDEAFLDLTNVNTHDYEQLAINIKERVFKLTGIPVSVGISYSKTLAKVASKIAKKREGICVLFDSSLESICNIPIFDVWGIGRATTKKLNRNNVYTIGDYLKLDRHWISDTFGICAVRTYWELKGESVFEINRKHHIPKSMMYTRSFKRGIKEKIELRQKIIKYTSLLSSQLRESGLSCKNLILYIRGNRFISGYYRNGMEIVLDEYTNLEKDLVQVVGNIFEKIYTPDVEYKKAGVITTDIMITHQLDSIFNSPDEKRRKEQEVVDKLNSKWKNIIKLGSEDFSVFPSGKYKSSEYTTNFQQLPIVF